MRKGLVATAVVAVLAGTVLTSCGSNDVPNFTKDDLPGLVLKPNEGPKGLVYGRDTSGPNALEREGDESAFDLRKLQQFGFQGDYGSQFFSTDQKAGIQFSESIALVFDDEDGAQKALEFLETGLRKLDKNAEDVPASGLGDDSWALRGQFFPQAPPTYFYGWRIGNAVQVFAIAGKSDSVSEDDARAFAERLEARAED